MEADLDNNSQFTKKSLSGYKWSLREADNVLVTSLAQKFRLPEIAARLLALRGIDHESAEEFLNPSIKAALPDPSHLKDMDKATSRIVKAIIEGEKIYIFGDYDVDGATSTALLVRFFKMAGVDVGFYIPDRMVEGYGPSITAYDKIKADGGKLIITVDCGTLAFEPIKYGNDNGIETIVIDHHLSSSSLPEAVAIVNPNRIDESSELTNLAAVGMCFLLAISVNRLLRESGFYKKQEPDILSLLDLVALGTVCDVMILTGLNRAFVSQGLKVLAKRKNKGLVALADVGRIDEIPSTYHLGFVLGPRINAGGRIGEAALGTKLLTTQNVDEAFDIALKLDKLNQDRQAIEALALEEAMAQAEKINEISPIIFVRNNENTSQWHEGIIGIVAGRLKEKFHKPAIVFAFKDGVGKASGRSVTDVDLGAAVTSAKMEDILINGGGHAMAAGLSIAEDKYDEFAQYINHRLGDSVKKYLTSKSLNIDAIISLSAITVGLIEKIQKLAPFGNGNPEPRFAIRNVTVTSAKIVGKDHIMCFLEDANSTKKLKAMYFKAGGTEAGEKILNSYGKKFDIAGKIKLNRWNGYEKAELIIDDVICY